jgi:hypothetical protein
MEQHACRSCSHVPGDEAEGAAGVAPAAHLREGHVQQRLARFSVDEEDPVAVDRHQQLPGEPGVGLLLKTGERGLRAGKRAERRIDVTEGQGRLLYKEVT